MNAISRLIGFQRSAALVGCGVAVLSIAMIFGPALSPPEFSWLRHSTSEQAGQNMPGAWIMRTGFIAFGLGVLLAVLADWSRLSYVRAALGLFGAGFIAAAIWSNAPIVPGLPVNQHEDDLHSVASGIVGAAFAMACAARLFGPKGSKNDGLAWLGLIVSVVIPLAMVELPDFRGALQRIMFVVSFFFVFREFKPLNSSGGAG
jgi:hypothetical protein